MTPLPTLKRISLESCSFTRGKNNIRVYGLNLKLLLKIFFAEGIIVKFWIYENHVCELLSEELNEGWSLQLYMQLLQLQKEKPEKNSGLYGIWTLDLCDTCAGLYQLNNK